MGRCKRSPINEIRNKLNYGDYGIHEPDKQNFFSFFSFYKERKITRIRMEETKSNHHKEEPRFELGKGSYKDSSCKILYFGHVPVSEAVIQVGHFCSLAAECEFFIDGYHRFDHATSFPFYELGLCRTDSKNKNGYGKGTPSIGHDVWIGRGATILSGVHISDGCVIGARTVITKDCPPYSIVVGNPGKIIGYRFCDEMIQQFLQVQWWNLPYDLIIHQLAPYQYDPQLFLEKAKELYLKKSDETSKIHWKTFLCFSSWYDRYLRGFFSS